MTSGDSGVSSAHAPRTPSQPMGRRKDPWALFVDVEGFSDVFIADGETGVMALARLSSLMEGLHILGDSYFSEYSRRIFAYQVGDGFFVVPGDPATPADIAFHLAAALHRFVLARGGIVRSAIARGRVADIIGCYPERTRNKLRFGTWDGSMELGDGGIMTVFPIMGTAVINSFRLSQKDPRGALMLLHSDVYAEIPEACFGSPPVGIANAWVADWTSADGAPLSEMLRILSIPATDAEGVRNAVRSYVTRNSVDAGWQAETLRYLRL